MAPPSRRPSGPTTNPGKASPGQDETSFRGILEALPVAVAISEALNTRLLYANTRMHEQFRIPRDLSALPAPAEFYAHAEDCERMLERLRREGRIEDHPVLMRRLDGSTFWDLLSLAETRFSGKPALISCHYDISDRKIAEAALLQSEERYALVARGANDGIWDWNLTTDDVTLSPRLVEMLFADPEKRVLNAEDWLSHVHPEDLPRVQAAIAGHFAGETPSLDVEYRMPNGADPELWLRCRGIAMRDAADRPVRMAGSQSDITAHKLAERALQRAAYVDPLTGLSNRTHFLGHLGILSLAPHHGALSPARKSELEAPAVLVIRLERLKRLGDSLGQKITDGILAAVAARLETTRHASERIARIDTDEFALLTGAGALDARGRAAEIWELLVRPILVGETEFEIAVRIGMTYIGPGARTGEEMVREAHLALEWSASDGEAAVFVFDETMWPQQRRRSQLEADLPAALHDGGIFVDYQPVVRLPTGSLVGFEALARWRHPEIGLVPPNEFIPIAEQSGTIQRLGDEVLRQAAGQLEAWRARGLDTNRISVAVNFSGSQLADRRSVRRLLDFLDDIPPAERRLNLEMTESILLADPDALVDILKEIKRRGVELSLDDFGTGYSSLSYLQKFPFDILKVDRSFISRLTTEEDARRLVRSIIQLGHDLGLIVVAEGVETAEQRDLLGEFDCDAAQGYLFSKPMAAERTFDYLRARVPMPGIAGKWPLGAHPTLESEPPLALGAGHRAEHSSAPGSRASRAPTPLRSPS